MINVSHSSTSIFRKDSPLLSLLKVRSAVYSVPPLHLQSEDKQDLGHGKGAAEQCSLMTGGVDGLKVQILKTLSFSPKVQVLLYNWKVLYKMDITSFLNMEALECIPA